MVLWTLHHPITSPSHMKLTTTSPPHTHPHYLTLPIRSGEILGFWFLHGFPFHSILFIWFDYGLLIIIRLIINSIQLSDMSQWDNECLTLEGEALAMHGCLSICLYMHMQQHSMSWQLHASCSVSVCMPQFLSVHACLGRQCGHDVTNKQHSNC